MEKSFPGKKVGVPVAWIGLGMTAEEGQQTQMTFLSGLVWFFYPCYIG